MIAPTRRAFLGGAAAAAMPALAKAGAPRVLVPARARTSYRARAIAASPRGQALVIAHSGRRTVAVRLRGRTRLIDVGGQPVEVAVSPDGRLAAVTTASWDEPGLVVFSLRERSLQRIAVGAAPYGVAFTADGKRIVVSGGEDAGEVHVVDVERLRVVARRDLGICPRAVAGTADGAWIALNGERRAVFVDGSSGRVRRRVVVPAQPDRVAVSLGGERLLVAHGGSEAERVSEIRLAGHVLHRHRVGRLPSGVGWTANERMVIALGGSGEIVMISPRGMRRRMVGGAPRGLAIAGRRAFTVDALTGEPAGVRL